MTDPGRPDSDPSSAGREPEDATTSPASDWAPETGGKSSAPGELADLVTPKAAPAPVWPAPGSVPPWSQPGSVPPAPDLSPPGSSGTVTSGAMPAATVPGAAVHGDSVEGDAVPVGAWTGPEGTATAPTAYGAVSPDGTTPPVGWTPPAAAPARKGINIGGWLIRGGIVAAIVVGGLIFRDRLSGNAGDLKVGDCFDDPGAVAEVTDVQHHPCNEAHDSEVMFVGDYPAQDEYPGDEAFSLFAQQQCVPAFEAYLGRDYESDTEFDYGFYYPAPESWSDSDREVACFIYRLDGGTMTSSVKKA
jgi:hypothetical protein